MKIALVILTALLFCSCTKQSEQKNGRFQMSSDAIYAYVIDTQTGQVWGKRHSGNGTVYIGGERKFEEKKISN